MSSARNASLGAILGAVLFAGPLAAQGTPALDVDGRRLRTGVDSLSVFMIRGTDTVPTGWIRDELGVDQEQAGPVLRRVYTTADRMLGAGRDSVVDRLETLTPVRQRSRGTKNAALLFSGSRVSGWMRMGSGDSVTVDAALPATVYNATSLDLVIRASNLGPGWRAEIPVFLSTTQTVVGIQAAVEGAEAVDGRPCWRVRVSFNGMPVVFWIDQETRQLRRQTLQPAPGVTILFRAAASRTLPGHQASSSAARRSSRTTTPSST